MIVASRARRQLKRVEGKDRKRLITALEELEIDPYQGDVRPIVDEPAVYRRRVGSWRVVFEVLDEQRVVVVTGIRRRTSSTY